MRESGVGCRPTAEQGGERGVATVNSQRGLTVGLSTTREPTVRKALTVATLLVRAAEESGLLIA